MQMRGVTRVLIGSLALAAACSQGSGASTSVEGSQSASGEGPTGAACVGFRVIVHGVVTNQIGLADLTPRFEMVNADAAQSTNQAVRDGASALLAASRTYDSIG